MKIPASHILDKGLDISLSSKLEWLNTVLSQSIETALFDIDPESLKGNIHLDNYDGEIECRGELEFSYSCQCAHCGEPLTELNKTTWHVHLSPWKLETPNGEDEEVELSENDLNFGFYRDGEIDLSPILNDEIALSFPYNSYCKDKTSCEDRFQKLIHHKSNDNTDPRWAALKNIKVRK